MRPLYAKEIRLLQPAFLTALLLAIVPVWLLPRHPYDSPESAALVPFVFGVVMLALSVFGREFGLQTFALLLAQPLERRRIWWTKSGLLAAAILTVFLAWCLSCTACLRTVSRDFISSDALIFGGAAAVVAFAGGLWTTLLLRQVAAGFWFTILVPGAIAMFMSEAQTWQVLLVLGLYAAAGFWWARRQFLGAQETAWTGGVVAFPGWRGAQTTLGARNHRPWAALFWKELQLHQVVLMGMAWLFLMHLVVLWLRRMHYQTHPDAARTALEFFGGIWLVVPLLASSTSVAEERKLGTLAQQMSLPVSRRVQFGMKLVFALVIGGLLSALLVCTAEGIGSAFGAGQGMFGQKVSPTDVASVLLGCVGLAFIGFYASTLARNVVQALAAAVVSTIAIWIFAVIAPHPGEVLLLWVWRGFLIYYIAWPALFATFLWLAWRNFRSESGTDHLWRRNALVLGSVLAGVCLLTCAIYNRIWELLAPVDPRPGMTRITGGTPVVMRSAGGSELTAILPDGRLWVDRILYDPGLLVLALGEGMGFQIGGHWTSHGGNQLVAGSDWVSAVANFRETVAIRADGTLWVSERFRPQPARNRQRSGIEELARLAQVGSETNWQDVIQEHYEWSVVLLKQDGTLWRLSR
jgi:ABC-type transport system involved in multi-copper enzyme maturation permease subunit